MGPDVTTELRGSGLRAAPGGRGSARDLGRLRARQHQQVLIGKVFRGLDAEPRRQCLGLHDAPRDAWALRRRWSRAAAPELVVHDAEPAVRLERRGQVLQERDAVAADFGIRVHHQHRVQLAGRQVGGALRAERRVDVAQTFPRDPPPDHVEHFLLDVLRVDHTVGAHPSGKPDREPAGAGTDVGHLRPVGHAEGVHDLVGFLPDGSIRTFEQAKIFRREQASVFVGLRRRSLLRRQGGERRGHGGNGQCRAPARGRPSSQMKL